MLLGLSKLVREFAQILSHKNRKTVSVHQGGRKGRSRESIPRAGKRMEVAGMTRRRGKPKSAKGRGPGRTGRRHKVLKMKGKGKVPRWAQLGMGKHLDSFCGGRIETGVVAKLRVTRRCVSTGSHIFAPIETMQELGFSVSRSS